MDRKSFQEAADELIDELFMQLDEFEKRKMRSVRISGLNMKAGHLRSKSESQTWKWNLQAIEMQTKANAKKLKKPFTKVLTLLKKGYQNRILVQIESQKI